MRWIRQARLKRREGDSAQGPSSENLVPLNVSVAPGAELASERLLLSVSKDYYQPARNLCLHYSETSSCAGDGARADGLVELDGNYFGLNEGTTLTNAQWLAQNLKPLGYGFFHIDEGYQYARGEYSTPNATLFLTVWPARNGKYSGMGLVPGIWTAPFEVSESFMGISESS